MHIEVNGYWPAYFPQGKLATNENIILEKAFWKMFFATRDIEEVEEFWLIYFMMTTNMENNMLENNEELGKVFRDTVEGQFEHDLYNKAFSNELETNETDNLQQRIVWWMVVVDRGGPIRNNVCEYSFGELFGLYRKAIDPQMQELIKLVRDRQSIPENLQKS